jgi:hypothetical protein
MIGNNGTLTSNDEEQMDIGGPQLIPALMFLILACLCGQACFLIHTNYPHWFTIGIRKSVVTIVAAAREQDDEQEAHKSHIDVPTFTTRPKITKITSCQSMY